MEKIKMDLYKKILHIKGITPKDVEDALKGGQFICPLCLKRYSPKYASKKEAFLTMDMEAREQWLSHICSTECWESQL